AGRGAGAPAWCMDDMPLVAPSQPPQPRILLLQRLQPLGLGFLNGAVRVLPAVERPPTTPCRRLLLQRAKDQLLAEPALAHPVVVLLGSSRAGGPTPCLDRFPEGRSELPKACQRFCTGSVPSQPTRSAGS